MSDKRRLTAKIGGKRVYLRKLTENDISEKYIAWLNDPEINRFLSTHARPQTYESVKQYLEGYNTATDGLILGIFLKSDDSHIGNVTLSPIAWKGGVAFVGICIGDKKYWGQGLAIETLQCVKEFAVAQLGLKWLKAGVCIENKASVKLFSRAGFKIESVLKGDVQIDGQHYDGLMLELKLRR